MALDNIVSDQLRHQAGYSSFDLSAQESNVTDSSDPELFPNAFYLRYPFSFNNR